MRRVFKYGTGDPLPVDAVYLSTVVEDFWVDEDGKERSPAGAARDGVSVIRVRLVWHYFEVEDGRS